MSLSTRHLTGLPRRGFLAGTIGIALIGPRATAQQKAANPPPDPQCLRCSGVGRIPLKDAKPFVWLQGTSPTKLESALGEQWCPICQSGADSAVLVGEMKDNVAAAIDKNRQWEERTGWKLNCVITRHATVHTQLTPAQSRPVGMALESLTLHLKRISDSLLLTPTNSATLELMLLWEKPAWEQFRKVMEGLYSREQLGDAWGAAREYNAYDHFVTPHMYETPQSVRTRPPSCGASFITARRELYAATDRHAPFWLVEGFAAYGDYVVHKVNRWFTVYDVKQVPVGDWLVEARKLAAEAKLRLWREITKRELRDWEPDDHMQTMAMAAFLLESEPARFLDYVRRLKTGADEGAALEDAYRARPDDLDQRFTRWLLARR